MRYSVHVWLVMNHWFLELIVRGCSEKFLELLMTIILMIIDILGLSENIWNHSQKVEMFSVRKSTYLTEHCEFFPCINYDAFTINYDKNTSTSRSVVFLQWTWVGELNRSKKIKCDAGAMVWYYHLSGWMERSIWTIKVLSSKSNCMLRNILSKRQIVEIEFMKTLLILH